MEIIKDVAALERLLEFFREKRQSVGLVPTMGALHEGHLSLIRKSKERDDVTVCSIFINPTQFNNAEDLENYPRTMESDLALLQKENCDIVFTPSVKEIYPEKDTRRFDLGHLDKVMEGKFRPGHFNGVAQVVTRLFEIVKPDRAYFGEKDFQQLAVIKHVVKRENLPVEIVGCPIVREPDGLAMSSRNMRLDEAERKSAYLISQVLFAVKNKDRQLSPAVLKEWAAGQFSESPLKLEYFEIADAETLAPLDSWNKGCRAIACVAAYAGDVRLIDNIIL